tara:strand:- start:2816 stop:3313 length:498 start_codon:yes stop_codon:yes gene_type:complete
MTFMTAIRAKLRGVIRAIFGFGRNMTLIETLDLKTLESPVFKHEIRLNDHKFDLSPVQDSHGLHFVCNQRFLIDPTSPLVIKYKDHDTFIHQNFLYLQSSPHGDQCIYLILAEDLTVSIRGVHKVTPEFIEKVPDEFKKDIINKQGWFACSLCEVIEGSSLGDFF